MVSVLTQAFTANMLYIDPAATSMLLTSITALVVACGAGIFIAWRAIRKKVNKALHIDENAKKEVEDELVISDELKEGDSAEENGSDAQTAEDGTDKKEEAETEENKNDK